MCKPEFLDAEREVMVVDRMTALEIVAFGIPFLAMAAAIAYVAVTLPIERHGHVVVTGAVLAVLAAGTPLLLLALRLVQVDFLLDRTLRAVRVRRRIAGHEHRSTLAPFADIVAVRVRGSSERVKSRRVTQGWLEIELVDGRSIRLTDSRRLGTAEELEALIAEAEPIALHLDCPVIPASLTKKAAVTPARWAYHHRSGRQWFAILSGALALWVGLLVAPFFELAWNPKRVAAARFQQAWSIILAGPAGLLLAAVGMATTRARVTVDAARQTLRRDARTWLLPLGRVNVRFDEVERVGLVAPQGDGEGAAWLQVRLRDGRAVPLSDRALVRGRDGIRLLLEANGRTAAAMMGVPFVA